MERSNSAEEYENDDFEDFEPDTPTKKRISTPHSSKKAALNSLNAEMGWDDDDFNIDNNKDKVNDAEEDDVGGQDLESYMQHYTGAETEETAKTENLEGIRPSKENEEEAQLQRRLGYHDYSSKSNHASPVKGLLYFQFTVPCSHR
jgi:hypothetical protein